MKMLAHWLRHLVFGATATYGAILISAFWWSGWRVPMLMNQYGFNRFGTLVAVVIGAAWASAYTSWRWSRESDQP